MNFIDKSLFLSSSLLANNKGKSKHISFGFRRNKLIGIGQNTYELRGEVFSLAKKLGIPERMRIPTLHSEWDLIAKLWGNYHIDGNLKVVVIRRSKTGKLMNSRPCKYCYELFDVLGVTKIWYSTPEGING